jgi:hypothetical protein
MEIVTASFSYRSGLIGNIVANPLIIFPFVSPLIAISLTLARDEKEYTRKKKRTGIR